MSIHTLAAWQACPYCDSVASEGTSTWVVTPPGETPTAPGRAGSAGRGGSSLVDVVGGDVEGFCSFDEQPATVSISSAPHSATRWGYLRMPLNLCSMPTPSGPAPTDQSITPPSGSSAHREFRPVRAQS